ncbi:MAG: MarR family transcriptional regulator [Deltaproteobacteria bacterium]|nr:MarR family transcriptional regulator [Deltaproteobacteria bacterium]
MKLKFKLEESLGFLANLAALELKYSLTRSFKRHGHDVTAEQFAVLVSLWEKEAQTQSELAEHLAKDKTNMTRILDGLEKRNLVVRRFNESDRRSYGIHLTEAGWQIKDKLIPLAADINRAALRGFSDEEEQALKGFLKNIFTNLR